MGKTRESEGRGIQSVEVGGRLLRALSGASEPMMLRDLAAQAKLAPAQAHAYLVSYRRAALVERDSVSGMYSLGPFALRMGLARMRGVEPLAAAGQSAADLSAQLGLMVALVVWGPHAPTAVRVQPGVDRLNVNVREGTIFSVVGSASGRVFAAFSDGEVVGARIRQELDGEARDRGLGVHATRREFEAGLRRVRRLAYAEGSGVPTPGVNSIAAPVFSASGAVELVLSVIGTADALPIGSRSGAVGHLAQTCRALSSFWPRTPALTAKA